MSAKLKIETALYALLLLLLYWVQYQHSSALYADADNYMHALRTIDFMLHPSMFEHYFTQTDYPFGEISHWTKLMDILMAVCALPFLLFMNLKAAVFAGGFILTPLCALGVLYFLQKIGAAGMNTRSRFAMYLILWMQAQFAMCFKVNRPDHHAVIILLAVWLLWVLFEYMRQGRKNLIWQAAVVCSAALWLAVEGVFMYACTIMFLYGGYLFWQFGYRDLIRFTTGYAAGCLFWWLLNPPLQGYFYADNGRISVLYVVLALIVAAVVYIGGFIRHKVIQFGFLGTAAVACLSGLWFGGYMHSPLPPEITAAFTDRISEMQGGANIYCMTYPVLGMLALCLLWYAEKQRKQVFMLLCFAIPYTVLSAYAIRFMPYAVLYAAVAVALWLSRQQYGRFKFAVCVLFLGLAEIISFVIFSLYYRDLTKPVEKNLSVNVRFFQQYRFPQGAVVSDIFLTPYVLWYAEHPTVASPYHRNVEGIVDNHRIFMSNDMNEVAALIKKHQVGSIVLPLDMDKTYYVDPAKNTDKLYGMMLAGHQYPEWLKENNAARLWNYVVLEIIPEKLPD